MGARRLEDLIVWQLACQLRDSVLEITTSRGAADDPSFRDQLRRAARSIPANIAEGFGRYHRREFARFLRYARGSAHEVAAYVDELPSHRFCDRSRAEQIAALCRRTSIALVRLIRYLENGK
jgi:four helix bundle protein